MRWDAHNVGVVGVWVNTATNEPVRWVRWYDDATHEYEAWRVDPERLPRGVPPRSLIYRGRAELAFLADVSAPPRATRRQAAPPGRECDEPQCHREAIWCVADVLDLMPVVAANGQSYRRRAVTGGRFYYDKHWRAPTVTSARGVTNEITEVVQP